jgi:hypothetical protein
MWLLLPNGGVVLSWLHTPWVAALLLGGVAALVLFGGGRERRRRRDRGRRGRAPRARSALPMSNPPSSPRGRVSDRHLFTAVIVGVVVFAVLSIVAFVLPTANRTTVSNAYTQQMSFGYRAYVRPGPVYPTGTVTTGDPIYLQLVHRVNVTATYQLKSAVPHQVHGTIRMRGTVTNTSGWRRSFWLAPPKAFVGDRARTSALIDITRLQSLTNRISAQIGSGGNYTVAIVPRVKVSGQIAGQPIRTAYGPSLSLVLGEPQFLSGTSAIGSTSTTGSAQQGLHQSMTGRVASVHATTATLGGVPVTTVRWIAIPALVLFALLALLAASREAASQPDPAERINSRYKHLIVPVEPVATDPDHPPIDVSSIDALAHLAERSERLILHDHQDDVDNYLIDDQGTLFRFSAPRAPTAHLNGSGVSGAHTGSEQSSVKSDQSFADGLSDPDPIDSAPGDSGLSDPDLSDPAAAQAAAILSSAAATLRAAAASATTSSVDEADAADEPHDGAIGVPEDTLTQPPDDEVRASGTGAAPPADGSAAAPVATRVRTRPLSLREIDTDPPPTMTHWSRRPQYRLGLTIGPLALTFLIWRRLRGRRRRVRGDDIDEQRRNGSWTTRNLVRR